MRAFRETTGDEVGVIDGEVDIVGGMDVVGGIEVDGGEVSSTGSTTN